MSNPADFIIENGVLTKYVGPGGDVVIPEGVVRIGKAAFKNNSSVVSVSIPNSVIEIEREAFGRCFGMEQVKLSDTLESIGEFAFMYCAALVSVRIPASVKQIKKSAFFDCEKLEKVELSNSQIEIGPGAFGRCAKLADGNGFIIVGDILCDYIGAGGALIIPDTVREIAPSAFYAKAEITSVKIGESVKKIGQASFYGCCCIKDVFLSASVASIGKDAFKTRGTVMWTPLQKERDPSCKTVKVLLHAPKGSYAAKYARRKWIPFEAD